MAKNAKQLREERATLIKQAQAFNDEKADAKTGLLAAEDQQSFDEMLASASAMCKQAERLESLDQAASSLGSPITEPLAPQLSGGGSPPKGGDRTISVRFDPAAHDGTPKYVNLPVGARGADDYETAFAGYLAGKSLSADQYAALQSDDSEQAGYLVASEQFASEMLKEVDDLVFVRKYAKIHTVREADSLGIRKRTSRAATFDWSDELQVSDADTALKYGKRVLTPHHLTGQIEVSRDLLRRSMVSIDQTVRGELSRDGGEVMEDAYLTGDGDKKPLGVFTASNDGISTSRDVATGSATGITADGLTSAKYFLKSQYRNGSKGSLRWLFHRDALKQIALLKDSDGHSMFRPGSGINGSDPDRLLDIPYDESERTPNTFSNGNYFGLLANWRYYEIADALDMEVQVLTELGARTNQIIYIARIKTDGMPTLDEAFVRLKCATS